MQQLLIYSKLSFLPIIGQSPKTQNPKILYVSSYFTDNPYDIRV